MAKRSTTTSNNPYTKRMLVWITPEQQVNINVKSAKEGTDYSKRVRQLIDLWTSGKITLS
jgi:hypothetical protein